LQFNNLFDDVESGGTNTVRARCCYSVRNNTLFGMEKSFEVQLTKELIELRLNG